MQPHILVTGGGGYLGSNLVYLQHLKGYKITVLDDFSRSQKRISTMKNVQYLDCDLNTTASVSKILKGNEIDVTVHLAAFAYVAESVRDPNIYYRNNLIPLIKLMTEMSALNCNRLVFTSSMAVFGRTSIDKINEDVKCEPMNPYGETKFLGEEIIESYSRSTKFNSVIFRLPNLFGSQDIPFTSEAHSPETHLLPNVLAEAQRTLNGGNPSETSLVIHSPNNDQVCSSYVRDFIHVSDVCSAIDLAIKMLLNREVVGSETFNLASDKPHSVLEVLDLARSITKQPILFKEGGPRDGDANKLFGDSQKFRSRTGWVPINSEMKTVISKEWIKLLKRN